MNAPTLLARLQRLGIKLRLDGGKLRYDAPRDKLTPAVLDEMRAHKAELIEFLREASTASRSGVPAIEPVPRDSDLPLSFPQQRLWFVDRRGAGSAYNICMAVRLSGAIEIGALEDSLRHIVRRHEVLRTTFTALDGRPVQRIAQEPGVILERVDLCGLPEADREAAAQRVVAARLQQPFDLVVGPLLRSTLIGLGDQEHVLLLVVHHIVFDGWSMSVLKRELSEHYRALTSGETPSLPDLRVQYADFAHWQNRWLQGEVLDSLLDYWRGELGEDLPTLELPIDRPRPAMQTFRGEVRRFVLPRNLTEALENLGRNHRTSLATTLLAAFQALLARWTGQDDIVVGSPIANRNRSEIENLIGFFVNTLVFRGDLSDDPTFTEFLGQVRRTALGAYDNQDLPFERLVEELAPERHLDRNPLFQVVFAMQNAPPDPQLSGLTVREFESRQFASRFDLEVHLLTREGHGLRGRLVYNPDLFDGGTIERLSRHFRLLLEGIVAEPGARVSEIPILEAGERHRLVVEWNDTGRDYPADRCLHQQFEDRVARAPDDVALVFDNETVTYGSLNGRANQVAHHLRSLGVGPETRVGICMERSIELVVGILGILKSGGAYVPLDPSYPRDRLAFIVEDSSTPIVLTQSRFAAEFGGYDGRVLCLDSDLPVLEGEGETNPENRTAPGNVAYVIYTSGSTGKPKGVLVEHASVARLFAATDAWFEFDENDVWTLFHSYAFDFSVWEIWGALLYGGRLVIVPYEVSRSPEEFYRLLARERVTVLNQTPSAFRQLMVADESLGRDHDLSLRAVIFGGEALEIRSLKPWFDRHGDRKPVLVNMYGITETTVHVTYRALTAKDAEQATASMIGRPIPDLQLYILDPHGQPVPIGVPGEIHVGGAGVARSYLDRPELTAGAFVPDPFGVEPGGRLYRTGDLARYRSDGSIDYLGRKDHQVKIRGFRIELGEIETALLRHDSVQEAVVLCREDEPGEKYLAAYVVVNGKETDGSLRDGLREFLRGNLPHYMVPAAFVFLDSMPLTPNGKVDRRSLPAPSREREDGPYVAPRGETERRLAEIWAELLGVDRVGAHDDFFDLGGHSLLAMRVLSRVRDAFRVDMPFESFFSSATVGEMARHLDVIQQTQAGPDVDDAAAGEREVFEL